MPPMPPAGLARRLKAIILAHLAPPRCSLIAAAAFTCYNNQDRKESVAPAAL